MARRMRAAAIVASLVLAACGAGSEQAGRSAGTTTSPASTSGMPAALPLVVDTDLASDDIVALLYLVSDPRVHLEAVTVSGTGEVTCPRGAANARRLLARLAVTDVPVACGPSTPLSGARAFPAAWRTAADGAYGLPLDVSGGGIETDDAVSLLVRTVKSAPAPVTLLTLGPLTDVALAMRAEPGLLARVAGVVVMGGAVAVGGNVQPEGATEPLPAEWNLYVDPEAAAAVVGSGAAVTLVSLDATNRVPLTKDVVARLRANDRTDATSLAARTIEGTRPPYLWDPLAAVAAAHPELVPTRQATVAVVTAGPDAGRTVEQADGAAVRVAQPPDAGAVIDHLIRVLGAIAPSEPLTTPTTVAPVGSYAVRFDGSACSVEGPATVPAGPVVVTLEPGAEPYGVILAHLRAGSTEAELSAWVAAHPGGQPPPMVDTFVIVADGVEGALPSPATVDLAAGLNVVVCSRPDGSIYRGATVTVG